MGASGWEYVTPYEGGLRASLAALHARVFAGGEWIGGGSFGSLDELWADEEFMGEEGTHSVLDIPFIVTEPDRNAFGTLAPLPADRLHHWFGTERPTRTTFEAALSRAHHHLSGPSAGGDRSSLFDEIPARWTGRYVLLFTDDTPTHLGIFGCSGD